MKYLLTVRHPVHDNSGHITDPGRAQMRSLLRQLQSMVNGGGAMVLSSPASQAIEGAEILATGFGVLAQPHGILQSDKGQPIRPKSVFDLVGLNAGFDMVILVTDRDNTAELPTLYAKTQLDLMTVTPAHLNLGWARVIDVQARKWRDLIGDSVDPLPAKPPAKS
jgi:hypothetical protein